jgi:hypothetical protein
MRDQDEGVRYSLRRRMRRCALAGALALLASLSAFAAPASHVRYLLWQLAAYADIVATGEIVDLDYETFLFQVDVAVVGSESGASSG